MSRPSSHLQLRHSSSLIGILYNVLLAHRFIQDIPLPTPYFVPYFIKLDELGELRVSAHACHDVKQLIMFIIRGLHALLWSTLALAATIPQDLPPSTPPRGGLDVSSESDHHFWLAPVSRRIHQRESHRSGEARFENGRIPNSLSPRQDGRCSESTFCDDGAGSFQCCGVGFRCCVADDGSGSCCPAGCEGEDCPPSS